MVTLEHITAITAQLQAAREELEQDNAIARKVEWQRLKKTLASAVESFGMERVQETLSMIGDEIKEAAEEAKYLRAREREEKINYHVRKFGRYPKDCI